MTAPQPNMTPNKIIDFLIEGFKNGKLDKLEPIVSTMLDALMRDADGELSTNPSKEAQELMRAFLNPLAEKYSTAYNEWAESQLFD